MLRKAYEDGQRAAFTRFKIGNMVQGAAAYNPVLNPSAAGGASAAPAMTASVPKPAAPPASPVAAGANKSNVLG